MTLSPRMRLAGVLLLCLAVRLAVLLFYPIDPTRETATPDEWHEVAVNLAQGRGYTIFAPQAGAYDWELTGTESAYRPTMRVPPVYPMALALLYTLFGVQVWMGQAAQILFDVLIAWVVYRIGIYLSGQQVGLVAALGWALYAPEATHVLKLRSEPLFTLLLCLWVWATVKLYGNMGTKRGMGVWGYGGMGVKSRPSSHIGLSPTRPRSHTPILFLSFLLLALLALCRPSMAGFAVVFSLITAIAHRSWRLPALALTICIAPWLLRGWLLFGAVVPIATNGGYSLYRSVYTLGDTPYITPAPPDFEAAYTAFKRTLRQQEITRLPRHEAELDAMFRSQAWRLIRAYPLRYIHLCGENILRLWFRLYGGALRGWKDWVTCVLNAGLLILAWIGFHRRHLRHVALLVAIIGYNTLFYAATLADPRYNTPIMPLTLLLAAQGVGDWGKEKEEKRGKGRGAGCRA